MRAIVAGMLIAGSVGIGSAGIAAPASASRGADEPDDADMTPAIGLMQQAYCDEECRLPGPRGHHDREWRQHRRHHHHDDHD